MARRAKNSNPPPQRFPAMRLNVLFRTEPEKARAEVTAAIKDAGGNLEKAAETLCIGSRTLDRILAAHPEFVKVAKRARTAAWEEAKRAEEAQKEGAA